MFVRHLRNRTEALSPRNRTGALRQFVSKAELPPELAFSAKAPPPAAHPVGRSQSPGVETAVLTPTKFYQPPRAAFKFRPADRTDNPKHREQLLKLAYEWAQAAALRASLAIDAAEDGRPRSFI